MWEIIKGTIRNTSIKYSYEKKNEHNALKHELLNKIDKLQKELENSRSNNDLKIVTGLNSAKQQMTEIIEIKLKLDQRLSTSKEQKRIPNIFQS